MENTVFVSLAVSGPHALLHIRQFIVDGRREDGMMKVNNDGVLLSTGEFASFMFQLKAIERAFLDGEREEEEEEHRPIHQTSVDKSVQTDDNESAAASPSTIDVVDSLPENAKVLLVKRQISHSPVANASDSISVVPKKRKVARNSKSFNVFTTAFASVLREHIDSIVKSQCLGCLLGLQPEQGGHELCGNPKRYVDQFFNDAMLLLDDDQVCQLVAEQRKKNPKLPSCPTKNDLRQDAVWCEQIKKAIVNLC